MGGRITILADLPARLAVAMALLGTRTAVLRRAVRPGSLARRELSRWTGARSLSVSGFNRLDIDHIVRRRRLAGVVRTAFPFINLRPADVELCAPRRPRLRAGLCPDRPAGSENAAMGL